MNPIVPRTTFRKLLFPNRYYHTRDCFGFWKKLKKPEEVAREHVIARHSQANLYRLVSAYHQHGHKGACVNPIHPAEDISNIPQLDPEYYGLNLSDDTTCYKTHGFLSNYTKEADTLESIVRYLRKTYCGHVTMETNQIVSEHEKDWLHEKYESTIHESLPLEKRARLGGLLLESQAFDHFLAKKFGTLKRYGAEGAESMVGFIDEVFIKAKEGDMTDVIICMPHRGRLNVLTGLLKFPPELLFHKINGNPEFLTSTYTTGDVVSHLISSCDLKELGLHVSMLPNPSHLEAVNPVAMGKARARMLSKRVGPYGDESSKLLTVQIHGDAAMSGQGIVMETFAMSAVPHFEIGGCLHFVVNNGLGFTTPPHIGRSSLYCSDISKMVNCPVLHVNGDYPEEVVKACQIAMDYIHKFDKDVIVVMNCFRKWGHNELDDPTMTQPLLYKTINSRSLSVPDNYWKELIAEGVVEQHQNPSDTKYNELNDLLKTSDSYAPSTRDLHGGWNIMEWPTKTLTSWDTGLTHHLLQFIASKSVETPDNFSVHPKLLKAHVQERLVKIQDASIDWSTAEAMAVGSLLYQGYNVRISGQDVGRGTFSHRHMMLVDQLTGAGYIPLNYMTKDQTGHLEIANSHLSEEAVLGFEYGFSVESPKNLVIWEAQFGDFFNGAQVIIDTFISSGEAKWMLQCGLVMLLPHGYDGAGPEHSSCRIERFLQMCNSSEEGFDGDDVNMFIVHPTTPAQYFHVLRRQMLRNFRKPLVVQSPKVLLRLPAAVSSLTDMGTGTTYQNVIGDSTVNTQNVSKVIVCSGKHFYVLDSYRKQKNIKNVAIIRLETLCPFPCGSLHKELSKFPNAKEFVWSQEEPANMGPWSFVEPRFRKQLGIPLKRVSRKPYGPPATGIGKIYQQEVNQLIMDTFVQQ